MHVHLDNSEDFLEPPKIFGYQNHFVEEIAHHIEETGKTKSQSKILSHMTKTNVKYLKKHEKKQSISTAPPKRHTRGSITVK